VTREGSPADDTLALGAILRQAIPSLPAPFLEITQHCEDPNPDTRWTAAMIENRLRGGTSVPVVVQRQKTVVAAGPARRWLALTAAGAVVLIAGAFWLGKGSPESSAVATSSPSAPAAKSNPPPAKSVAPAATAPKRTVSGAALSEVMPEIPQAARDTITGRVRINVRVTVDPKGAVTEATLDPPKASKYFTDRVLSAARRWTFKPSGAPQEFVLRFELVPDDTRVSVTRAGN
jgi:TonB family protein